MLRGEVLDDDVRDPLGGDMLDELTKRFKPTGGGANARDEEPGSLLQLRRLWFRRCCDLVSSRWRGDGGFGRVDFACVARRVLLRLFLRLVVGVVGRLVLLWQAAIVLTSSIPVQS